MTAPGALIIRCEPSAGYHGCLSELLLKNCHKRAFSLLGKRLSVCTGCTDRIARPAQQSCVPSAGEDGAA